MTTAARAAPVWREASTDHFIIYADTSEKRLRDFAERLEKFDSGLRYIHGVEALPEERSNRLLIYVVADGATVTKLCGASCSNVDGFYVPHIGGSIAFTLRSVDDLAWHAGFKPEVVLFHEYTHHFLLANSSAAYPRWLNEGFAEFNSTAEEARDGSMCFGRAAQHRAYGLLRGDKLPLDVVLEPGSRRFSDKEQDIFYGRSWLLLHYLKFEAARSGQLSNYVKAFNNGKSSLDAALAAFGDLAQVDKDLDRYLSRGTLSCRKVPAANITAGAIATRTLTAGETATLALRMRSDRGMDQKEAQSLVPEGRQAAKAFPDDAGAQTVLTGIEYGAGHLDEAEAAADRALAANPRAREALLYKGRITVRRLENMASNDALAWKKARGWFIKANQLDPNAAEPLYLFFMSYVQQHEQPTENAAAALEQAFKLSPQDQGLRWMYAQALLNSNRTAEARVALIPIAYDPHQSGDNRALAMVRAIDAGATGPKVFDAASGSESAVGTQPPP
ncbi:tetratricopeptide repeat protein [Hydrocarboniphaga sp.]|uniref:tetratricopeptide repeat protein n=1 Tax=Hydrocarboniphaga sp. TaxID=2033016 RepID=UPI003D144FCD